MEPILLIHGYSAESKDVTLDSIRQEYGSLVDRLRTTYTQNGGVVELDLSRYISLDDGVTIDDVSRALNNALLRDFPNLLNGQFTSSFTVPGH